MKKILIVTCLSLFLSTSGTAQVQVVVAPGVASVSGGDSWDPMFGALGGIQFPITKFGTTAVMAGIMMAYQGAAFNNGKLNLIYAYAPLVMQFLIQNKLYGQAGLMPGAKISAKEKIGGTVYDQNDHVNTFELAGRLALMYMLNNKMSLALMWNHGITKWNKTGSEDYRNFLLSLALIISLNSMAK